jgi:hypothetical protein
MSVDLAVREPGAALVHAEGLGDGGLGRLFELAITGQASVETLERLEAMHQRAVERSARMDFLSALAEFQDRCPNIRKSGKAKIATKSGASFSFSYAPLDEIANTIRPYLREVGLSYAFDTETTHTGDLDVICILRHTAGHEERARFPVPVEKGGRMSDAQANGAALTYGKRQALIAALGLTTADEDTDAAIRPSAETVTPDEMRRLEALLNESGADVERFLKHFHADSIKGLPRASFAAAVEMLERKKARRAPQEGAE